LQPCGSIFREGAVRADHDRPTNAKSPAPPEAVAVERIFLSADTVFAS
jgi:hypothetical protein